MGKSLEQRKNVKRALVSILIVSMLFSIAFFSPSATATWTERAPQPPIDVQFAFSKPPALSVETQFACSVISTLDVPSAEVTIEISKGFGLLSGALSWSGNIPANTKFEAKLGIKALQTGDWTIRVNVRSTAQPLLQVANELHVYVLKNAVYINEYPPGIRSLCVPVANPSATGSPLGHEGLVPENPQPFQPESPGTLTVTGRFWCYISQDSLAGHTSDIQQPMVWGNVLIYRASDGAYLGGGVTGPGNGLDEGYFSIPIENPGSAGFYVAMRPWTSACHVVMSDGTTDYISYTPIFYPSASQTTYDVGGWRPPDQWDFMGAWRIYESEAQDHYDRGAWDFMVNEGPGYMPPEVKVRFKMPDGSGTYIDLASGTIYVDTEAYSKALDVVQHEYGHWVMYNAYGGYWPPNAGGAHSINRISNPNMAWTEGWADAFPEIVQSYGRWEDWYFEWGQGSSYDLENCPNCDPGDQCEARVAGTLWDIFDSHIDGYDYFVINLPWQTPNHFLDMWSVLSSQTDAKYLEFYQAWRAQGKDRHLLNYCSYQNTIVYDNSPDLTNGYVTPLLGYPDTSFRFYVTYQDADWDPPGSTSQSSLRSESNPYGYVRLYVYDGGWTYYVMNHYNGNPESTETFYKDISGFSVGGHNYYFTAYDGISGSESRYPGSGYLTFTVGSHTYPVHLESRQDNSATSNLGTITFDGVSYNLPADFSKASGTYQATYYPALTYVFDHWETSGGISVPDPYGGPLTSVTVSSSGGTLRAIYRYVPPTYPVHLESRQDNSATSNLGTITFDGVPYNLPNDVSKAAGTYQATYYPASNYVFDHWEVTSGITVSSMTANPTSVTVGSSGGTLRAIYKLGPQPVHLESRQDNSLTSNLGTITFDGVSYNLPADFSKASGTYQATYYPALTYVFDHWEVTSSITVSNAAVNPTSVTVSSPGGTLRAVYKVVATGGQFDFGTASSPVEAGYVQVTESTAYSVALGYGWDSVAGLGSRDRGAPDNLRRDFVFSSTDHTFNVDLLNGDYSVVLIIGDYSYGHDLIRVYAEGTLKVDDLTVATGTLQELTVTVTVSDGQLNLLFHDNGGTDANWVINAIAIQPPSPPFNIHLESAENTGATLNLGSIIFDGTSYALPKDVSNPTGTYVASYMAANGWVLDHWETSGGVTMSGTMVTVTGAGGLKAVYKVAPSVWKFDFGTGSSPVESGYVQVTESTAYSVALGYGWDSVAGLGSRDRGAPDNLRRDFVFSSTDHTFNVDLANGQYKVTLIIGDQSYMHDLIDVYAEGILQVNHLTVKAGEFSTQVFTVAVSDGQLNIKFHENGGLDDNWVINAIIIQPATVGGQFDFGTGSSPVESGYVQVTESTAYSVALGYGWDSVAGLGSRDRGAPDNLKGDFVFSGSDHTFNVDLANGNYKVTLVIGDNSYTHDLIDVYAENVLQVNHLTVNAGTFSTQVFTVTVSDGQLNIKFHENGGLDDNWVINAIIIQPAT